MSVTENQSFELKSESPFTFNSNISRHGSAFARFEFRIFRAGAKILMNRTREQFTAIKQSPTSLLISTGPGTPDGFAKLRYSRYWRRSCNVKFDGDEFQITRTSLNLGHTIYQKDYNGRWVEVGTFTRKGYYGWRFTISFNKEFPEAIMTSVIFAALSNCRHNTNFSAVIGGILGLIALFLRLYFELR